MPDQVPFRCTPCNRLLFMADEGAVVGALTIKCPRCNAINILRPLRAPSPERPARPIEQGEPDATGQHDPLDAG